MKISYAITVCNEEVEIQRLVTFLFKHKELQDEIVITYDSKNGVKDIEEYLKSNIGFNWHSYEFNGNFSQEKEVTSVVVNHTMLELLTLLLRYLKYLKIQKILIFWFFLMLVTFGV